jgi:hypothetical protein
MSVDGAGLQIRGLANAGYGNNRADLENKIHPISRVLK